MRETIKSALKAIAILTIAVILAGGFRLVSSMFADVPGTQQADDLEAFLEDPVANFDRLKAIPNLCDRVMGYDLKYVLRGQGPLRSFLDPLFERHFQEMDRDKMEIVLYLFKELRGCQGSIWDKTREIFSLQPKTFIEALKGDREWKGIISGLSWKWDVFSVGLAGLGDSVFEKEIREFALSLNQERGHNLEIARAFVHDPVANFEKIKTIDNISRWIYYYERTLVKDGYLSISPIDILLRNFREVDEKKIEIIVYLIMSGYSGYHGDLLLGRASRIFKDSPQLFLSVLERTNEWKSVISTISSDDPEAFKEGLEKVGDSEFVREMKRFLSDSQEEREKPGEALSINWDEVKKAFDAYGSCPSEENARWLLATIPETPAGTQLGTKNAAGIAILESPLFEKAVVAGDDLLAEAAFRLFGYMNGGGAVEEELRIMLGRFLTRKPEAFLRLLKKYRHLFPRESDYPVDMTEILEIVPDITSHEDSLLMNKESIRLYTERIKALERVEDPELMELRDACIRVIRTIIAGFKRRAP